MPPWAGTLLVLFVIACLVFSILTIGVGLLIAEGRRRRAEAEVFTSWDAYEADEVWR